MLLIKFHKVFEMGGGWKREVRGGAEPRFAALVRMIHVGRDVLRTFSDITVFNFVFPRFFWV